MTPNEYVATRLREQRQEYGWSLEEMAAFLTNALNRHVSRQVVSQWEHSRKAFHVDDVSTMALYFGKPITWMLGTSTLVLSH